MRAITNDRANELRWSRKGGLLMLDIARGLTFLHANKVSLVLLCLLASAPVCGYLLCWASTAVRESA